MLATCGAVFREHRNESLQLAKKYFCCQRGDLDGHQEVTPSYMVVDAFALAVHCFRHRVPWLGGLSID
jgi:hypothetical protein